MKLRARVISSAQTQPDPPKEVIKEEPVKLEPAVVVEPPAIEKAIGDTVEENVKSEPVEEEPVTEVRPKKAVQRCRSINRSLKPQQALKKRNPIIGIRI